MEYNTIGRSDLHVSRIGVGGLAFGGHYGDTDKWNVIRTIRAAVEKGVTFFDTSPTYGNGIAEAFLGEALGSDRNDVVIATKNGAGLDSSLTAWRSLDRETIFHQVEQSLRRLRREYIDIYFVYGPDPRTPLGKTMDALEEMRNAGKIRSIGFCTNDASVIREALQYGHPEAVLAPYNVLDRTLEQDLFPFCRATNIDILACEPFCRGLLLGRMHKNSVFDLTDLRVEDKRFRGEQFRQNIEIINRLRSLAYQEGLTMMQLALGWNLQNASVKVAVCGVKSATHIDEALAAANIQLTPEQILAIDQIVGEDVQQHAE